MKCPRCQHENPTGMKFCGQCAAPLASTCPSCGAANPPENKFCGQCAVPLRTTPTTRFAAPDSYTPKHLAEKILTSKAALEGERKQVTVLFADLKGSMELLADRDPEYARKLLDPVVERMMEGVHRYEGTVNQIMGDGIMALFGAPLAHEDHAVRACYAALRMQESVTEYAEGVFRSHGVPIQIRVGLNSGEVVVRAIGSDLHMDYTAVGQTTHLAARMEQMATPGTILLAPATLQLAEGYVQVAARGPVAVKGLADPVEVYALTGASVQRTRLHAAAARGLTRFVGRDTEIEQIRRALALAQEGHGQLVAVMGEPGVGKSRLVYEFIHSHRTQDWLILEAGSVSYGKATSYLPVIDLLKAYFKVQDREGHREIREKITGKLLTLDRALEPILPALLALLDIPVEEASWQALDPPQRRRRTLDAVRRLLLRESQVQPLLVIFEDLHWIDAETQAFLESLVDSLPTARVLLLVNYRPEYQHGWGSKTYYTQLRLDALRRESASELLLALLGSDASVELLKSVLISRTGGNPLFLEESVRALAETGALGGERGAYRLARPLDTINIPATVQAILAARIDRLDLQDKQLLQMASVIGKDVPFALLLALSELPEEVVRHGLARLQAAEFLYETDLFPELEYTFKHALTHEVAYGELLYDRRRFLHAQTLEVIEDLYADRQGEQVDRLAHHALRGELWDQAVNYARQSAAKARSRSASREAVAHLEQALSALQHLPETHERQEQAVDIRIELAHPLFQLGDLANREHYLREAATLATVLRDRRRDGLVSTWLTHQFWIRGDQDRALEYGQRAVAAGSALGDTNAQTLATSYLGQVYYVTGDFRQAIRLFKSSLELLDRESQGDWAATWVLASRSANARVWLACALSELGEFAEADHIAQEAVRIAEATNNPWLLVHAHYAVGLHRLLQGNLGEAIHVLERGVQLQLSLNAEIPITYALIAPVLGAAYALAGRPNEGIPLLKQACDLGLSMGAGNLQSRRTCWWGEACLLAGAVDDAMKLAQGALQLARDHRELPDEARAHRLLGAVTLRRDLEQADGHYHAALAVAERLGMRPLVAHCHLGLGKLYRRIGNPDQAKEHLSTATTMYREMDMRFWLEKAETEMREFA
jgi:class 3 adenylate cyclase/tetratricopeptide (TPR) repeat protein